MTRFRGTPREDQFFGTSEDDYITGGAGQDQLRGGDGADTIEGGDGPDALYGDLGNDWIDGGPGNDVIRGGKGSDNLRGGGGFDVLFGDMGDDLLFASNDVNILIGGAGDDWLYGSYGGSILEGGPGDDVFFPGPGREVIRGGAAHDTVDYSGSVHDGDGPWNVHLVMASINTGRSGYAKGDVLIEIQEVIGSPDNDFIDARDAGGRMHGMGGDDTLLGGGTVSTGLVGGPGNDHLSIHAVSRGSTMQGGPGEDLFRFFISEDEIFADSTILDFQKGQDQIELDFGLVGDISRDDVERMLDQSEGYVLNLELLGEEFEGFGEIRLADWAWPVSNVVPVSTLDWWDFIFN